MVGAEDFIMDICGNDPAHKRSGHYEIVDTPPCVPFTGIHAVRPPRILDFLGVQLPPGIAKARRQHLVHASALLVGEAGIAAVGAGVLQVNFLMRHIHIPANDHRLLFRQTA